MAAGLAALGAAVLLAGPLAAQGGGPGATPQAGAPIDLTGYWVAVISEDWRWRMVTPSRGDFPSIPLNLEAQRVAEAWDPARDEAAGEQCRAYGAPGVMRGPTRLHITWHDAGTLKVETDYGMQTRLLAFAAAPPAGAPSWQGVSTAEWVVRTSGRGAGARRFGALKSVTTHLRPGYLRKNGVPYSAETVLTEYWDVHQRDTGETYLVLTTIVDDPVYLQDPWLTALHFRQEPDGSKWHPEPCDARF
jgi:hypothetical protein